MFEQLGLVGCGLMGGSFALALKRAGLVKRVVGFSPSEATTSRALQMGVIDQIATSASNAATGSDLVLIAVPVSATEASFQAIAQELSSNCLVMDVGSTKSDVLAAAKTALGKKLAQFVPAHPIAGKEVAGVEHADADLYTGCQVILTPTDLTDLTDKTQLQQATSVWQALGCKVRHMSAADHDAAFAAVSHLPHLLAFAFMNGISSQKQRSEFLDLAGPGFRDFTRIAAGDPKVWRDIFLANSAEVLAQSQSFRSSLEALERAVLAGDSAAIEALISQASHLRAHWSLNGPSIQ
ncbi:MAG: prephenate dehydrogenase/arogenate dehydrogenase family protein [Comamonadaceae bacterium]